MASLILVPQSHNSPKELICDDKSLLLYARSKFLIIMLIWSFSFGLLTILDTFPFHLVMYLENVSLTPCLVVSKSLKVTSIIVLKMNWSTNNSTSSFHTLVLLGSKLYYHLDAPPVSEKGNACKVCFSSNPFISELLRYLLICCFRSPVPSKFSASKILNFGGNAIGVFELMPPIPCYRGNHPSLVPCETLVASSPSFLSWPWCLLWASQIACFFHIRSYLFHPNLPLHHHYEFSYVWHFCHLLKNFSLFFHCLEYPLCGLMIIRAVHQTIWLDPTARPDPTWRPTGGSESPDELSADLINLKIGFTGRFQVSWILTCLNWPDHL